MASSDVDILQAWSLFLGEVVSRSGLLGGLAVRFIMSRRPKLTCEVASGPGRADMQGFLNCHPLAMGSASAPRVVPWNPPIVALELQDLPAGVYAMGAEQGAIEDVMTEVCAPRMIEALEHTYRVLDKDVGHIKRVAMHSKHPCVLVDEHHHVHACNLAAKHLLREENGELYISSGDELCFRGRGDSNHFNEMLNSFFAGGHDEARTLLDNDLLAMISRDKSSGMSGERLGLVHLKKLRQPLVLDPVRVATITKLTMSQARLVCALVRGQDLKEYVEETGLSLATVRWHMRKALSRMECGSQYQLVSLMKEIFG